MQQIADLFWVALLGLGISQLGFFLRFWKLRTEMKHKEMRDDRLLNIFGVTITFSKDLSFILASYILISCAWNLILGG